MLEHHPQLKIRLFKHYLLEIRCTLPTFNKRQPDTFDKFLHLTLLSSQLESPTDNFTMEL